MRLPVTSALISVNVLIYVAVAALGSRYGLPLVAGLIGQPGRVLDGGWLVPALVEQGDAWRLLSSMFLHSGLPHIAFNMIALYILGSFAETAFGRARFFTMYLLSGLSGGLAYLYLGELGTPAVGASGAIFGLLGGVFGYTLRQGTFSWENPLIRQLLILTAINLFLGFSVPNISNIAHIGGLIGGLVFGWLMAPTRYSRRKLRAVAPAALVLAVEAALLGAWLLYL